MMFILNLVAPSDKKGSRLDMFIISAASISNPSLGEFLDSSSQYVPYSTLPTEALDNMHY